MLKILLIATAVMSLLAFLLMGIDKRRARKHQWRISERTLLLTSACFGGIGGTLGMFCFHHKTKHWYFRYGLPAMMLVQLVLLLWAGHVI